MAGGDVSDGQRVGADDDFPVALRSTGGAGDPGGDRGVDDDGGVDRLCHPADDSDAGVDAVFTADHRELREGSRDAVDAGDLPGDVFLLHGGAARGAVAAASI